GLSKQLIYSSSASNSNMEKAAASFDGSMKGSLKTIAYRALSSMQLNITVLGLQNGQHIECKTLEEVMGAEEALRLACEGLKNFLDCAATFDGHETIIEFTEEGPKILP